MSGPLTGYKVIEIAGIGPGPFCAMLLADMGAEVIRVDRAQNVRGAAPAEPPKDVSLRNRRSIALDLKHPDGVATLLDLVARPTRSSRASDPASWSASASAPTSASPATRSSCSAA